MARTPQVAPQTLRLARSGAPAEDRARSEQAADLGPLLGAPLLKAVKLGRYTFSAAADKQIPHGLGRALVGWLLVRKSAFSSEKEVASDSSSLTIRVNVDTDADLWVW